ncbi:MAG TPA: hypothetical protein PL105_04040, partial [Caldilineaceae bacterium]|nr:hypothetical protein [Caldilineaceae bacterium]
EMLTGLEFERLIALAQERVRVLAEAQGVFVAHLRRVHEAWEGWELNDWAQGFVRVVEDGQAQGQPQQEVGDGN